MGSPYAAHQPTRPRQAGFMWPGPRWRPEIGWPGAAIPIPSWRGAGWWGIWGAGYGAGPAPAPTPFFGCPPPYTPRYYGVPSPTEAEIKDLIYNAFETDPEIPADANINVSIEAGIVHLRGDVANKRIKHAAGDDAWWQPGVVDVRNELRVTAPGRGAEAGRRRPR